MKPTVLVDETEAELREASAYLDEERPGWGAKFEAEVERVLGLIGENPKLGARYRSSRIRYFVLRKFSYVIYYQEKRAYVRVLAIAQSKRRPGYWRKRL